MAILEAFLTKNYLASFKIMNFLSLQGMLTIGSADLDKRPSGFESTRPENNYGICFGSEPKEKILATELLRFFLCNKV